MRSKPHSNRRFVTLRNGLVLACALQVTSASAQNAEQAGFDEIVDAVPLERAPPEFPTGALQLRREGWVLVSYLVGEDGTVSDAMVEDSTGERGFERAALRAVEDWRYTPAMQNGKPVLQGQTEVWMVFRLQGTPRA